MSWHEVWWFAKRLISWASSKQAGWLVGFKVIGILRKPTSLIRSFNIKVTTKPRKHERCSVWLTEANYTNKTFMR